MFVFKIHKTYNDNAFQHFQVQKHFICCLLKHFNDEIMLNITMYDTNVFINMYYNDNLCFLFIYLIHKITGIQRHNFTKLWSEIT